MAILAVFTLIGAVVRLGNKQVSSHPKPSSQADPSTLTDTFSQTVPAASDNTSAKADALKGLSDSIDSYVQLFAQGKQALGGTQYDDAYAGLAALNDPSSNASQISDFNHKIVTNDYTSYQDAYDQVANIYGSSIPDSLTGWRLFMGEADGDMRQWGDAAGKWEIHKISTEQLNNYELQFNAQIANARSAVQDLQAGK